VGLVRLTERQWRIYIAAWLTAVAAVGGVAAGLWLHGVVQRPAPPQLSGGMVVASGQIKAPDFTLHDQSGAVVSLSALRGQVVALTFLDTKCTNLCPLQARLLAGAQTDLGAKVRWSVVIVSVRPEADTPATIAAFAAANGLARYRWLTGTHDQLAPVWNEYGVTVQPTAGDLEHSSVIYLIDGGGFERVGFLDVPETDAFENDIRVLAG